MTNNFRVQVGQRIRRLREAAGYRNQGEFARLLDISPSELSRIERGLRRLDTVLLRRIGSQLDVSLDDFFIEANNQPLALARRGDADEESMTTMVAWAMSLRSDLDLVAEYVQGAAADD